MQASSRRATPFEQQIADAMAERVVDAFEVVQVDIQDIDRTIRRQRRQHVGGQFLKLRTIGQTGQAVVERELVDARLHPSCSIAIAHKVTHFSTIWRSSSAGPRFVR